MTLVSVTKISSLMLASVAEQANLNLAWSETPEDMFCRVVAQVFSIFNFLFQMFGDIALVIARISVQNSIM